MNVEINIGLPRRAEISDYDIKRPNLITLTCILSDPEMKQTAADELL